MRTAATSTTPNSSLTSAAAVPPPPAQSDEQKFQHQTLRRRRCHSVNLSVPHDHDENYRGTGHPRHYRVHPKELALQLVIQPSSLKRSTKMRMLLINPESDDAKRHLETGVFRKGLHPDREELTLTRRPQEDLQNGRHST
mgnify:CR=1 FL=1